LDHKTLPDGPSTYLNAERPLIDNGERIGSYFENICESKYHFTDKAYGIVSAINSLRLPVEILF